MLALKTETSSRQLWDKQIWRQLTRPLLLGAAGVTALLRGAMRILVATALPFKIS
jgi:hypothetical protein